MKRWPLVVFLLLATPVSSQVGCGGDGCLRNSDCSSDMMCSDGECVSRELPAASGGDGGDGLASGAGTASGGTSAGTGGNSGTASGGSLNHGGSAPDAQGGEAGGPGGAGGAAGAAGNSLGGAP
jgi:hypothetical protein